MIIEIQYLKDQHVFKINLPEESVQNVMASVFDDNSVNVSIMIRDEEGQA